MKRMQMMGESGEGAGEEDEYDDDDNDEMGGGPEAYLNSRMSFGMVYTFLTTKISYFYVVFCFCKKC